MDIKQVVDKVEYFCTKTSYTPQGVRRNLDLKMVKLYMEGVLLEQAREFKEEVVKT